MATTADLRNGLYIQHNHDVCKVTYFQHVKPGKGSAFVRTKLKSLTNQRVIEKTFPAGAKITTVDLESQTCQYLYKQGDTCYFMDTESFETIAVPEKKVPNVRFLKEGDENTKVRLSFLQDTGAFITYQVPANVVLAVEHTDEGARGNTANRATKPATLENGTVIQVPLFIKTGEHVKIDTEKGEYLSRE